MITHRSEPRVLAVLGPTNTGKTHFAVERMLSHRTGMIGFPLRLLARENYDRIARIKGADRVALITGEEKIVPARPAYWCCTVEAMPLERRVSFLAVDEIQLAAGDERGHVFTDRLLGARGLDETMFLGSDTIRPLLRRLVREAEFIERPRFSNLTQAGAKRLARLPQRSAIVAFSANQVYALAEAMRRQRGGAAVVLGALSPRARNAQVAMFENGEVDYLVATDAIGMGLNLDIDHVAFAALRKFDGRSMRPLRAAEIAQIAGRAGRHMSDGTFGTTADSEPLDPALAEPVENHRFPAIPAIRWRNPALRFHSLDSLRVSLAMRPPSSGLLRVRGAEDEAALDLFAQDPGIAGLAATPDAVRLLWEVCRIPDYRKTMTDNHIGLLGRIYRYLMEGDGRLPTDWMADRVTRLDRTDGDIDTLAIRIAYIRTWTFISNRGDWLDNPLHWRERTRAIEDRLSDALHHRLTQRFVDRRTSVLVRRLKDQDFLAVCVETADDGNDEVFVEGQYLGRLSGLHFTPDRAGKGAAHRALMAAARRALQQEIRSRLSRLLADPDTAFASDERARILWRGAPVGRLVAGDSVLAPRTSPFAVEFLDDESRRLLARRLAKWPARHVESCLSPLLALRDDAAIDDTFSAAARGLIFRLCETMGSLERRRVAPLLAALTPEDRRRLRARGMRTGRRMVYLRASLRPSAIRLRALLWSVAQGCAEVPPVPGRGRISVGPGAAAPEGFYEAIGFPPAGGRAVRADMLERLAATAAQLARQGSFRATPALLAAAGCGKAEIVPLLIALGYEARKEADELVFSRAKRKRRKGRPGGRPGGRAEDRKGHPRAATGSPETPFAKLATLLRP